MLHYKPFALYFSLTGRDTMRVFLLKVIIHRQPPSLFFCVVFSQPYYLMSVDAVQIILALVCWSFFDVSLEELSPSEPSGGAELITRVSLRYSLE